MVDRNQGNPSAGVSNREMGRVGSDRSPTDIPAQAACVYAAGPGTLAATYSIGPSVRPAIVHDNGFLGLGRRPPAAGDYLKLAKWKAMLEGAEALRPDLTDALAAYRHFLEGNGADRDFSYERFVRNDESGPVILQSAILDLQSGVVQLWSADQALVSFRVTGTAIPCGGPGDARFPYPASENWQKAIGAHYIWLSAEVTATPVSARGSVGMVQPRFWAALTLHAEDRYNFNPGAADIATGIPDSDNGVFEMTGLAHQYDQFSVLRRNISWEGVLLFGCPATSRTSERHRQPTSNRRLRNRL